MRAFKETEEFEDEFESGAVYSRAELDPKVCKKRRAKAYIRVLDINTLPQNEGLVLEV